jgi:hypothetical protein
MAPTSIVPTHFGLGPTSKHPNETSFPNFSMFRGRYAIAHDREQDQRRTTSCERKRTKSEKMTQDNSMELTFRRQSETLKSTSTQFQNFNQKQHRIYVDGVMENPRKNISFSGI